MTGFTVVVGEDRTAPFREFAARAVLRDVGVEFTTAGGDFDDEIFEDVAPTVSVFEPTPPEVSLPESGTGVDITSPVRVTTTICTSSCVAPFAGIVSALASSGVTDRTS